VTVQSALSVAKLQGISLNIATSCLRWRTEQGFIPAQAKSVEHEARNGMLLCRSHHGLFDSFYFYIRWVPQVERFVLINHSELPSLEPFHGRAIGLFASDSRVPFHGAFLIHEMRVRGYWPFAEDREILLPVPWQPWIQSNLPEQHEDGASDDEDSREDGDEDGDMHKNYGPTSDMMIVPSSSAHNPHTTAAYPQYKSLHHNTVSAEHPGTMTIPRQTLTMTNPFANPAALEALKHSFAEQPNWKAAVVEGESWEGTAEANIQKWRGLVGST